MFSIFDKKLWMWGKKCCTDWSNILLSSTHPLRFSRPPSASTWYPGAYKQQNPQKYIPADVSPLIEILRRYNNDRGRAQRRAGWKSLHQSFRVIRGRVMRRGKCCRNRNDGICFKGWEGSIMSGITSGLEWRMAQCDVHLRCCYCALQGYKPNWKQVYMAAIRASHKKYG